MTAAVPLPAALPAALPEIRHPRDLALGVGCGRDASPAALIAAAEAYLAVHGLAVAAVACVVSVDLKADAPAVHALAAHLGVPARFFPAARLEAETPRLATRSAAVFRAIGCHGVAEAAALAAVGAGGALVAPRLAAARVTVAAARATTTAKTTGKAGEAP